MDKTTLEALREGYELEEIIIAGVQKMYSDKAEQMHALIGVSQYLRHHNARGIGVRLWEYVVGHRDECLEAGVCPHCGEEAILEMHTEYHQAPFGPGTAPERGGVYVCSGTCGEI